MTASRRTLLLCLALCASRMLVLIARPLHEQGWLHLRVAGQMLDGQGLAFNPGEPWEPLWSSLAPLWSVLVAGVLSCGLDPRAGLVALQIGCELWVLLALGRLLTRHPQAAFLAQAAWICLPQLARNGIGGSEASLALALALQAVTSRRTLLGGVWSGLAVWVRPELLLLGAVGRSQRFFLGWAVVLGLGAAACLSLGSPPPIELALEPAHVFEVWKRCFVPHVLLLPLLPLVLWGLLLAWRAGGELSAWSQVGLGWIVLQSIFPHTLYSWHFSLPWAAWCVWLAHGLGGWRSIAERQQWLLLALGLASLATLAVWTRSAVHARVHEPLIEWARATSRLEPRARVLASDVGALGFGWHGTVLSSEGWLWPAARRLQEFNNMLREAEPEYVLLSLERDRWRALQSDPWVREHYQALRRFSPTDAAELEPTVDSLDPRHRADYLLLGARGLRR